MTTNEAVATPTGQRAVILEHAAQLFLRKGYRAATMDDLAASVQLNKATVYYYYKKKSDLLYEIVLSSSNEALTMTKAMSSDIPADEKLRRFIMNTVKHLTQHAVVAGVFYQEEPFLEDWLDAKQVRMIRLRQRKFEEFAESIVRDGQAEGAFRPGLDPWLTIEAVLGMMHWYTRQNRRESKQSTEEIATQWADLILNGLTTPSR